MSKAVTLQAMSKRDALTLLIKAIESEEETNVSKLSILHNISEILGYLPLALDVAGAAIHTGLCKAEEYKAMYGRDAKLSLTEIIHHIKGLPCIIRQFMIH
jgi:hypothetical protein